jgi:hypothetical protein
MNARRAWVIVGPAAMLPLPLACGARTELPGNEPVSVGDAGLDARPIVGPDGEGEAPLDALPPVDVVRLTDASVCPVGGTTAYIISDSAELYTLDPQTLTTHLLGAVDCPSTSAPWTLTASSSGRLYAMYQDWNLYEVDPKTLVCTEVARVAGQVSLGSADGITVSPDEGGESLYVYGQAVTTRDQAVLARGDLTTFVLSEVGPVTPAPSDFPLDIRADAFGRIFGLARGGGFVEIDRTTAALVAEDHTGFVSSGTWALLTYNDSIYFFAGGAVSKYDLATKNVMPVGDVGIAVMGASAAPCLH